MSITVPLPTDSNTRKFSGPGGKLPKGFVNTSDTNYAGAGVVLVKADGETPLVVASNADAVSNTQDQVPTSARLQAFNGTTWDRARGDTTNGLDVDVTRLPALVAGSAIVGKVGIDQTTPGSTNAVSPLGTGIMAAATASEEGDEAATDEAVFAAGAGTRLMGFSARETAGSTAVFKIRNGTSNADPLLVTVSLAPGESAREWYGPDGIAAASGIWLERVSGTVEFVGYGKVVP